MLINRHGIVSWLGLACAIGLPAAIGGPSACRTQERIDPVEVLATRLTHGHGETQLRRALRGPLLKDRTNASLLLAARHGTRISHLRILLGDHKALLERIAQLEGAGLLIREGDLVQTSFPILIGERQKEYERITSETAEKVYGQLSSQWASLFAEIGKRNWQAWAYHFVMAHVFDSQFTWSRMVERKLVPPLYPPVAWVIYPPHLFKTGTNYFLGPNAGTDYVVVANWTPTGAPVSEKIERSGRTMLQAALNGTVPDAQARDELTQLGLLGPTGQVLVPLIRKNDPLYSDLQRLGHAYVDLLAAQMPVRELESVVGVNREFAWVVAYHDLSWGILQRLVRDGRITMPSALRTKGGADESLVGVCSVIAVHQSFFDTPN